MSLSISQPTSLLILLLVSLLSQNDFVSSSYTPTLVHTYCIGGAGNYTARGAYKKNLGNALSTLATAAVSSNATFSNTTVGDGVNEVFALYYCTGLFTSDECGACLQAATTKIVEMCPNNKEAIIWYVECTLRYANRLIFGITEETPSTWLTSNKTVPDYTNFGRVLTNTSVEVSEAAAVNFSSNPPNYAWREVGFSATETLVALAQCAPGLTDVSCIQCLSNASSNLGHCCILFSYVNMAFLPSCRLLFVVQTSNSTSTSAPPPISNSPVVPSTPYPLNTSISPNSINGTIGSDGKILKCRNNVISAIALPFIVLYYMNLF